MNYYQILELDKYSTTKEIKQHYYKLAKKYQPKIIICGGSAYPRHIEFDKFREIASKVGAFLMADIAHPSGLVAAGLHPSPMPYCDVVTTTTHKTLRGPRGGMIMMGKDFENEWGITAPKSGRTKLVSELLNSAVMPGVQGGPLMHIIAAKALAFGEALDPSFKVYAQNIVDNAKTMSNELLSKDYRLISGGTDTHVILIDLTNKNVNNSKYLYFDCEFSILLFEVDKGQIIPPHDHGITEILCVFGVHFRNQSKQCSTNAKLVLVGVCVILVTVPTTLYGSGY